MAFAASGTMKLGVIEWWPAGRCNLGMGASLSQPSRRAFLYVRNASNVSRWSTPTGLSVSAVFGAYGRGPIEEGLRSLFG